ncbi:hypothetical protein JB92DRAFT_2864566 [Gautieria morchelliformis]|nr:hypothetical protein JB92DRAFT_2864566 [Gautieria morchelliformis]
MPPSIASIASAPSILLDVLCKPSNWPTIGHSPCWLALGILLGTAGTLGLFKFSLKARRGDEEADSGWAPQISYLSTVIDAKSTRKTSSPHELLPARCAEVQEECAIPIEYFLKRKEEDHQGSDTVVDSRNDSKSTMKTSSRPRCAEVQEECAIPTFLKRKADHQGSDTVVESRNDSKSTMKTSSLHELLPARCAEVQEECAIPTEYFLKRKEDHQGSDTVVDSRNDSKSTMKTSSRPALLRPRCAEVQEECAISTEYFLKRKADHQGSDTVVESRNDSKSTMKTSSLHELLPARCAEVQVECAIPTEYFLKRKADHQGSDTVVDSRNDSKSTMKTSSRPASLRPRCAEVQEECAIPIEYFLKPKEDHQGSHTVVDSRNDSKSTMKTSSRPASLRTRCAEVREECAIPIEYFLKRKEEDHHGSDTVVESRNDSKSTMKTSSRPALLRPRCAEVQEECAIPTEYFLKRKEDHQGSDTVVDSRNDSKSTMKTSSRPASLRPRCAEVQEECAMPTEYFLKRKEDHQGSHTVVDSRNDSKSTMKTSSRPASLRTRCAEVQEECAIPIEYFLERKEEDHHGSDTVVESRNDSKSTMKTSSLHELLPARCAEVQEECAIPTEYFLKRKEDHHGSDTVVDSRNDSKSTMKTSSRPALLRPRRAEVQAECASPLLKRKEDPQGSNTVVDEESFIFDPLEIQRESTIRKVASRSAPTNTPPPKYPRRARQVSISRPASLRPRCAEVQEECAIPIEYFLERKEEDHHGSDTVVESRNDSKSTMKTSSRPALLHPRCAEVQEECAIPIEYFLKRKEEDHHGSDTVVDSRNDSKSTMKTSSRPALLRPRCAEVQAECASPLHGFLGRKEEDRQGSDTVVDSRNDSKSTMKTSSRPTLLRPRRAEVQAECASPLLKRKEDPQGSNTVVDEESFIFDPLEIQRESTIRKVASRSAPKNTPPPKYPRRARHTYSMEFIPRKDMPTAPPEHSLIDVFGPIILCADILPQRQEKKGDTAVFDPRFVGYCPPFRRAEIQAESSVLNLAHLARRW